MIDKKIIRILLRLTVLSVVFLFSCGNNNTQDQDGAGGNKTKNTIMVFSAASLTDVITELADSFEVKYKIKVLTNLASSGTLARQIEQGANPAVYISASKKWADYIDSIGYLVKGYKADIANNELVLVAPVNSSLNQLKIDSSLDFSALLGDNRLSIGDPSHVPAGKYAKQSLAYYGWFNSLTNKILPAKDVRSALMVVEMEEAPVGIVYRTDALKSDKVKIIGSISEESHKPIVYVAGICNESEAAKYFFAYINSEEAKNIWLKYGFKK